MWRAWINFVLGLWLILSGIVTSLMAPGNLIIVGVVISVLALWEALQKPHMAAPRH